MDKIKFIGCTLPPMLARSRANPLTAPCSHSRSFACRHLVAAAAAIGTAPPLCSSRHVRARPIPPRTACIRPDSSEGVTGRSGVGLRGQGLHAGRVQVARVRGALVPPGRRAPDTDRLPARHRPAALRPRVRCSVLLAPCCCRTAAAAAARVWLTHWLGCDRAVACSSTRSAERCSRSIATATFCAARTASE